MKKIKYTNKLNLPAPLFNALTTDSYDPGAGDYTPSSLSRPAYMARLEKEFEDKIVVEASDRVWSLLGKAGHHIMESGSEQIEGNFKEERIYYGVGKWMISMQFDNLFVDKDNGILDDYKVTSVYKFKPDYQGTLAAAPDWEAQLNIGAYILRHSWMTWKHGELVPGTGPVDVKELRIVGILKDHRQSEARYNKDYPQHPIAVRNFRVWDDIEVENYITEKATERDIAHSSDISSLTPCSDEEMWATPDKWALMKKSRKSAVKLFESLDALHRHVALKGLELSPNSHYVEERPGERKRCQGYCDLGKNGLCPHFEAFKKGSDVTA